MTDYYLQCETAFMARARTLTKYFEHDWQVSDDDSVINRGANYFLIVRPGAFPITPRGTRRTLTVDWNIIADLYVRWKSYKESWSLFKELRSDLFNLFLSDPNLDNTSFVWNVMLLASGNPGQAPEEGTPAFIGQTLIAVITQEITIIS